MPSKVRNGYFKIYPHSASEKASKPRDVGRMQSFHTVYEPIAFYGGFMMQEQETVIPMSTLSSDWKVGIGLEVPNF